MSTKVKVAVRVRPFSRREIDLGTKCVIDMDATQTILSASRERSKPKTFTFDHSFWTMDENDKRYAGQDYVYKCLGRDVLHNSFEGYNACIFAYGQTGSGKTYTMMGAVNQKGIIPRLCDELFDTISKEPDPNITYKVEVSYIEIYNEKVRDLLCPRGGHQSLRVREHKLFGPYVEGLTKLVVNSFENIESLMLEGNKSRTVAATNMNTESSRSHAVFNIVLTRSEYDEGTECVGEKVSKMSLVDLAGSERVSKTGAEGDRLKEGSNINRSLVTLGQVISSLADQSAGRAGKKAFVPYRNSVLTWLLKDNLGGNSKTVMVATISPSADNYEETLSTLRYADHAKRIVNHAVVNEDPNAKIIRELREEVEMLKKLLAARIAGPGGTGDIEEKLSESEKLMRECTMSWEQKEKQTEKIQQERHKALVEMGISVQSSGIAVESGKFYLVNLNADPAMNELLVYYLKEHTLVGRHDASNTPDIQLAGLGLTSEHCSLDIEENEVYLTPMPNARSCVNGKVVVEKTKLNHGDRVLFGSNHFFRVNCPRSTRGDATKTDEPADFMFAQEELMMNEIKEGPLNNQIKVLEEQYEAEKQGALEKQRQMYEEKIEELRNQIPTGRPSIDMDRSPSLGSFSSGYGSNRMSWCDDSRDNLASAEGASHKPLVLKEEVLRANALVREANQLSEEMSKDTEFAVTLQIPTSSLSFSQSQSGFSSEVAIVVKHKSRGTQIWSLENLANKIYDMREMYNQCIEEGIPFTEKDHDSDLFFEVECHTLIGVANVFLECLLHDVSHEYAAPIISQQGEVCGRLKVEVSRGADNRSDGSWEDREEGAGSFENIAGEGEEEAMDDDSEEEFVSAGGVMQVVVTVMEACDLPPALCNYVFCQYKFFEDENTVVVPPMNASLSNPGPKINTMIFEHQQQFDVAITDEFLEYVSVGSLAIEVWGNRSKGFDAQSKSNWSYPVDIPQKVPDRWADLVRKMELWVEIHELNEQGEYAPVELQTQRDNETGGIFQLRQGHSRRIVVRTRVVPKSGSLPVVCNMISGVYAGSICCRNRTQRSLESYQEKDLSLLREKWSNSLMKRRTYLDEQLHALIDKEDKSMADKERESWLIDQWVSLTEERNAVVVPVAGSGIPGAPPLDGTVRPGLERHNPVLFLDLSGHLQNTGDVINDIRNGCVEEAGPAGVDSTLSFENPDKMVDLPIIKYDQKQVSATVSWDSSIHDSVYLNRVTPANERVYLIVKVVVRLASPLSMDLVLRKRICVKIYKRQSWKDTLLRRITRDIRMSCGVCFELVSHIPRQPGEETEERASLAQMAAQAVGDGEGNDKQAFEEYTKGISHVASLLALDRLRQEVVVKEKLAAIGKPLRKFASTPNLAAASGDLFGGGSKFDSPDTKGFLGPTRDLYHPSGSFSEPRGHKVPRREDILVDVSSFSSPIGNSSAAPRNATSAVTPRANSGLTELETLVEVETSPRPSPRELKPNELLFDFNEAEQSGGQSGGDELRERSGSSDTLTYEDLPTPTPDSKNARPDEEASSLSSVPGGEGTKTSETDLLTFEANDEDEDADESMGLLISSKSEARTSSDRSGSQDELASCDSQEDLLGSSVESEGWKNENSFQTLGDLRIGQVISVGDKKTGTIRFLGTTEFSPGLWVGVELDVPAGKNDGSVRGVRYFACKPRFGSFIRPEKAFPVHRGNSSPSTRNKSDSPRSAKRAESPSRNPVVLRAQAQDNRRKNEWKRRSNILF